MTNFHIQIDSKFDEMIMKMKKNKIGINDILALKEFILHTYDNENYIEDKLITNGFRMIPDDFVVHAVLAVDQAVTKSDNFPPFGAPEFQGRLHGHGLAQSFADDLELALDRGTYEFTGGEIGERLSLRESPDSTGGFQGVDQSLGDFNLHRESADRWRWRGGGSGYEPSGR